MCEAWLRLLPTATCVKLRAEALSTVQHVSSWGLKLYPQCSTCNRIFKLSTVQHVWICEGWSSVHRGAVRAEALPTVELWGLKLYPLWSCEGWSSIHWGVMRAEALSTVELCWPELSAVQQGWGSIQNAYSVCECEKNILSPVLYNMAPCNMAKIECHQVEMMFIHLEGKMNLAC